VTPVAEKLSKFKAKQEMLNPEQSRSGKYGHGIIGINFGKNKDRVLGGKDEEGLGGDYVELMRKLSPYADYIVINISSPNTPHLRELQSGNELKELLGQVMQEKRRVELERGHYPPLLIKIAPDLTRHQAEDIARVALDYKIDGIIVSNTTVARPLLVSDPREMEVATTEIGGLSGKPLFRSSTELLGEMYELTNGRIPLIGVGGISSGRDAYEKIKAGASLVQLYTGLVFEGPGLVPRIKRELVDLLAMDGFKSVEDAIGHNHRHQPPPLAATVQGSLPEGLAGRNWLN